MKRPLRSSRHAAVSAAPASRSRAHEMFAELESRCLLSTVTGTPGSDLIELNISGGTTIGVVVNGVATKTASSQIQVDALDGNDTIVIKSTGYGSLAIPGLAIHVRGQGGSDTLALDDSGLTQDVMYKFRGFALDCEFRLPGGVTTYDYDASVENVRLDQSDRACTTVIDSKPAALRLQVNANGGDDQVFVGNDPFESYPNLTGGDLDSDGMDNLTIFGGAGRDLIAFNDTNDCQASGESETLVLDFFTATKGDTQITYSAFEKQTVQLADGLAFPNSQRFESIIKVNALCGFVEETIIYGGHDRPSTINLGNGRMSNLSGVFSVRGWSPGYGYDPQTTLTVDDSASTDAWTWQVFSDRLVKGSNGQRVNYSDVDAVQLRTGLYGGPLGYAAGYTLVASEDVGAAGGTMTDLNVAGSSIDELLYSDDASGTFRVTSRTGGDVLGDTAIEPAVDSRYTRRSLALD